MGRPIRVMCVDDSVFLVEAIQARLSVEQDFEWAGYEVSADELVPAVDRARPDVVLLDVEMPGRDPFEALEELTRERPRARVVVLTGDLNREREQRAGAAGAAAMIDKSEGPNAIVSAIRRVGTPVT